MCTCVIVVSCLSSLIGNIFLMCNFYLTFGLLLGVCIFGGKLAIAQKRSEVWFRVRFGIGLEVVLTYRTAHIL